MAIVGFVMRVETNSKIKEMQYVKRNYPTFCLDGRKVELHARQEGAASKSTWALVSKRKEDWTMATIRNDEIRGYRINGVGDVCNDCVSYEEQDAATLDEILTDQDLDNEKLVAFVTGARKGFKGWRLSSAR
jgi:hypothetical protein